MQTIQMMRIEFKTLLVSFLFSTSLFASPTMVSPNGDTLVGIIVPTLDTDPSVSIDICSHPRKNAKCEVLVASKGMGVKTVLLAKRDVSGKLFYISKKSLDIKGKVNFLLTFTDVGTYNLLVFFVDGKGAVVGLDGIIFDVNPPAGQLGEQFQYGFTGSETTSSSDYTEPVVDYFPEQPDYNVPDYNRDE